MSAGVLENGTAQAVPERRSRREVLLGGALLATAGATARPGSWGRGVVSRVSSLRTTPGCRTGGWAAGSGCQRQPCAASGWSCIGRCPVGGLPGQGSSQW